MTVEEASIGVAVGDRMNLANARAGVLYANQAELNNSSSVILLARDVHGDVETVLDTRGAMLAGLVSGIAVGLVLFVGRLLTRRR